MVPWVQLPAAIQLVQTLAGNEQVTRDRAVRKLRKYIVARTQRAAGGFTHDELLKVWKGLFYCMWKQDKPLLQEDLGRTISQLVHAFQTTEAQSNCIGVISGGEYLPSVLLPSKNLQKSLLSKRQSIECSSSDTGMSQ